MAKLPRPVRPPARYAFATLLAATTLSSGCGGGDRDRPGAGLAELAPPDAPLFAEVTLRPSGEQAEAIASLASRLGLADPASELAALVDDSLGGAVSYSDDVEPWLGDHAALFIRSFDSSSELDLPDFGLLAEAADEEAARALVDRAVASRPATTEERAYGGYEYAFEGDTSGGVVLGMIDDAFFAGTEESFKVAVDAAQGESLAESDEYATALEAIGGEPVATLLVEPSTAIEAAIAAGEIRSADADLIRPLLAGSLSEAAVAAVSVAPESAALELALPTMDADVASSDSALIERLPADSWAALGIPDLGPALERTLDRLGKSGLPHAGSIEAAVDERTGLDLSDDVTAWLGDAAAYVAGTDPGTIEAGVRAETSDPDGPEALLGAIRDLPGGATLEAEVTGDELVVAIGRGAKDLIDPPQTLADSEAFAAGEQTLGGEFEASAYLDLPALLAVARAAGEPDASAYAAAKPYLEQLAYVIAGTRFDDGLGISRVAVGVAGE